jgi:hypothetical protein
VQTLGAAPRRRARRRRRPRRIEPGAPPLEVPLTRFTVIPAQRSEAEAAARELERVARDAEAAEARVADAVRTVNALLRAHRIACQDPYGHEIAREGALVVRAGYGTGEGLAEGRWDAALEIPPSDRSRRVQALRPQERLAAVLAGREAINPYESLLLRARADLDGGRAREAAIQLAAALEALLTEPTHRGDTDEQQDITSLESRREATATAANEAFRGELPDGRTQELEETLRICERVLRRRRVLRRG